MSKIKSNNSSVISLTVGILSILIPIFGFIIRHYLLSNCRFHL